MRAKSVDVNESENSIIYSLQYLLKEAGAAGHTELYDILMKAVKSAISSDPTLECHVSGSDAIAAREFVDRYKKASLSAQRRILEEIELMELADDDAI